MKIIPVMDLMNGVVVHARRGERENYRPIRSTLCPSAAPEAILRAFVENFKCDTVYIADLDAIRFRRPQLQLTSQLKQQFSNIQIWLDSGITDERSFKKFRRDGLATPVIGSESLAESDWLEHLAANDWILSLDFKANIFQGTSVLLDNVSLWPTHVLAMTLDQVGSEGGPDFSRLCNIHGRKPRTEVYAAGGIRHRDDLKELRRLGISGALVATALHNGSISPIDL
jgi:phosphoribosylformimino-5-aminoimidazole carboxamide ribotide isomerase